MDTAQISLDQNVSPSPPAPPANISNSQLPKILLRFFTYIAVFLLGIFSFWIYQEITAEETKVTPTAIVTPTSTLSPTPTTKQTSTIPADWKTYRNEKYRFQFSYPKSLNDISIKENPDQFTLVDLYLNHPDPYFEFSLEITSKSKEEIFKNMEKDLKEENIEIDGVMAVKYSGYVGIGSSVYGVRILLFKDNLTYFFSFGTYNQKELLDQILSAFKFLD